MRDYDHAKIMMLINNYIGYYLVLIYASFALPGNYIIEIFNHVHIYIVDYKLKHSYASLHNYCNYFDLQNHSQLKNFTAFISLHFPL